MRQRPRAFDVVYDRAISVGRWALVDERRQRETASTKIEQKPCPYSWRSALAGSDRVTLSALSLGGRMPILHPEAADASKFACVVGHDDEASPQSTSRDQQVICSNGRAPTIEACAQLRGYTGIVVRSDRTTSRKRGARFARRPVRRARRRSAHSCRADTSTKTHLRSAGATPSDTIRKGPIYVLDPDGGLR